jgi:iron complex transport system permease protein
MKVVLDLSKLREDGKITQAEYDRFLKLAGESTGSLAINILIAFGVISVAGGLLVFVPNAYGSMGIGAALAALGLYILYMTSKAWQVLGTICVLVGTLLACGGLIALGDGSVQIIFIVALILAAAGIVAKSGLLVAASVLALAACMGARTGYRMATYSLAIHEPTMTILAFSVLALVTFLLSKQLKADYERLAIMAARVSIFLVNFGFWIGSLWGDRFGTAPNIIRVPSMYYSIGWALALIAIMIWGVRENRRWVVNIAATFGAIHFYTQWFHFFGPNPLAAIGAGLLALAFAIGMWKFNQLHNEKAAAA